MVVNKPAVAMTDAETTLEFAAEVLREEGWEPAALTVEDTIRYVAELEREVAELRKKVSDVEGLVADGDGEVFYEAAQAAATEILAGGDDPSAVFWKVIRAARESSEIMSETTLVERLKRLAQEAATPYENEVCGRAAERISELEHGNAELKEQIEEANAIIAGVRIQHPQANRLVDDIIKWRAGVRARRAGEASK